jgi:hypothetical protein
MISSRRIWIRAVGLLGAAVFQRQAAPRAKCRGVLSGAAGVQPPFGVRLVGNDGQIASGQTDPQGRYEVDAPSSGEYVLVVFDLASRLRLADVKQLSGGVDQSLSLTVRGVVKSFAGALASLDALESIAALAATADGGAKVRIVDSAAADFDIQVNAVLAQVRGAGVPTEQLRALEMKADVAKSLHSLGTGGSRSPFTLPPEPGEV